MALFEKDGEFTYFGLQRHAEKMILQTKVYKLINLN